jgi:hypothetical protein
MRAARQRAHRLDLRPLLRDGPRPALGPREPAYDLIIVDGNANFTAADALSGLKAAYARGETDEFVQATVIAGRRGSRCA